MKKALTESRRVIDSGVINRIYGDLSSPELTELIDNVLDGVTERVDKEVSSAAQNSTTIISHATHRPHPQFESILENHDLNNKLLRLEQIVDESQAMNNDKETAAVPPTTFASLLPDGVTPQDVLRMNAHNLKLSERERLISEIASLEEEGRSIEAEIEEGKKEVRD